MNKKVSVNVAFLSLTATSCLLLPWTAVQGRGEPAAVQMERAAAEQRAAAAREREAQLQQARAEQEQARQQHEASMRQAAEARQQQEQALRSQEQEARKAQQEQVRQQQEQARQQQQQARQQQQQARQHQQQARQQQEHAHLQQEQQAREHQDQPRLDNHQPLQEAMTQRGPSEQTDNGAHFGGNQGIPGERGGAHGAFFSDRQGNPVTMRAFSPPPLSVSRLPLEKAIAMPVLAENANPADRLHLQEVQNNLRQHMYAVSAADAPSNFHSMPYQVTQNYFNNYQTTVNNQPLIINRQNTFVNPLPQNNWPIWYQPQPNWQFCNGFTLGHQIACDLNWLRWGWHPYYGPEPDGFVCANNYVPTPWIYIPAYGTWRQPGVNSYAGYGPPFDYTGPISVEVFEPRRINFDVPFGGFLPQRVINAIYFYNAYYYPEFGRYGYMNRHGNWIWLNTGNMPF